MEDDWLLSKEERPWCLMQQANALLRNVGMYIVPLDLMGKFTVYVLVVQISCGPALGYPMVGAPWVYCIKFWREIKLFVA